MLSDAGNAPHWLKWPPAAAAGKRHEQQENPANQTTIREAQKARRCWTSCTGWELHAFNSSPPSDKRETVGGKCPRPPGTSYAALFVAEEAGASNRSVIAASANMTSRCAPHLPMAGIWGVATTSGGAAAAIHARC